MLTYKANKYAFENATIGGTFHSLHHGHKEYMTIGFRIAEHVYIGLTSDEFATHQKSYKARPWDVRRSQIENFLLLQGYLGRAEFYRIDSDRDVCDFCLATPVSVAVVEPAYFEMFLRINELRREQQKEEMCLVWKPRTKTSEGDLSSTSVEAKSAAVRFGAKKASK